MNAILKSFLIICGIPTLVASIYFGAIASDVYVSEARFAIRTSKSGGTGSGLAAFLSSPMIGSGGQESVIVTDYVMSQDMLSRIEKSMDLRKHYSDPERDVLSRLKVDATDEELLEYYQKNVELLHDTGSDVITLKVHAYDAMFSQKLALLIIEQSEDLVNRMSNRIESDGLSMATKEVDRLAARLRVASDTITKFRNDNNSLDPAEESAFVMGIVSSIEARLSETRTMLSEKLAYMKPTAPEIITLKNRLNALNRQLGIERGKVAGEETGVRLSGLIDVYQPLALEKEMTQQQYASALTSLEMARLEAQRKKQYLIAFILPNLPDEALEPRRFYEVLTVLFSSLIIYLICGLMWSALRDHIRV